MQSRTSVPGASNLRPGAVGLMAIERETRRLFVEHRRDPLTRLVIAVDALVRRMAHRVAARLRATGRVSSPTSH